MKKMQCEVCGSNEIKKVADGVFECQSCGVQYSTEEVQKLLVEITGAVKIDHSDEVKNNIKRGEQFEEFGNVTKAQEYYNKALDLDAENTEAKEHIKNNLDAQQFENYYIISPNINPNENVKDFLKQLATIENIACDIYKEISIKKVTEQYYTFMFMKGKYKCNWSLTACRRYYENETVYKEKYDPNLKRYVNRPETQKVEKIERTPMNGTKVYEADEFALASNELYKSIWSSDRSLVDALVNHFEKMQNDKYGQYTSSPINFKSCEKKDNIYYYKDIPLNLQKDYNIYKNRRIDMQKVADQRAADEVMAGIGCDFCEGISATSETLSESVCYICVPIQIIEYAYKGRTYTAIADLISKTKSMPTIFPSDKQLSEKKEELNKNNTEANSTPGWAKLGWILFVVGLIIGIIGAETDGGAAMIIGLITWFISYFLLIPFFIRKAKLKKQFETNSIALKEELFNPRQAYLSTTYNLMFENFKDFTLINDYQNKMPLCEFEFSTKSDLAKIGEIKTYDPNYSNKLSDEEKEILKLEKEIDELKKKRILPIVIMCVFGILIIPLIVGAIMLGNVNSKIITKRTQISNIQHSWINK